MTFVCLPGDPTSEVLLLSLHLTNEELSANVVFLEQACTVCILLVGSYASLLSSSHFFLIDHKSKKCKNHKFWLGLALGDNLILRYFEV